MTFLLGAAIFLIGMFAGAVTKDNTVYIVSQKELVEVKLQATQKEEMKKAEEVKKLPQEVKDVILRP